MSRRLIRLLVALSVLAIVGILVVQIGWLSRVNALGERQFRQSAIIALQEVAGAVAKQNHIALTKFAVTQLSPDYFVVNTNSPIDPTRLEGVIQVALRRHTLLTDFEYGIYDCETDQMVYGNYVGLQPTQQPMCNLPTFSSFTYYFGIRFPNHNAGRFDGWVWSTVAVGVVVLLFGYTLVVVLRQRRLADLQRDFINNITHELQTPVSTIRIAADTIYKLTSGDTSRLNQYARILQTESLRLQKQVQNVLHLARLDQAGSAGQKEPVDLHDLFSQLALTFAPHIQLDLRAVNPLLCADRLQLDNLLNNLIDNAMKYCHNTPCITLGTANSGQKLLWSVADTGIGIAPEHQAAVFQQFYRVQTGRVQTTPGFGLGLHFVRQVAQAHGWQLRLESRVGQGSRFSLVSDALVLKS